MGELDEPAVEQRVAVDDAILRPVGRPAHELLLQLAAQEQFELSLTLGVGRDLFGDLARGIIMGGKLGLKTGLLVLQPSWAKAPAFWLHPTRLPAPHRRPPPPNPSATGLSRDMPSLAPLHPPALVAEQIIVAVIEGGETDAPVATQARQHHPGAFCLGQAMHCALAERRAGIAVSGTPQPPVSRIPDRHIRIVAGDAISPVDVIDPNAFVSTFVLRWVTLRNPAKYGQRLATVQQRLGGGDHDTR